MGLIPRSGVKKIFLLGIGAIFGTMLFTFLAWLEKTNENLYWGAVAILVYQAVLYYKELAKQDKEK